MDKIKEKLHIGSRRKSQPENDTYASKDSTLPASTGGGTIEDNRDSIDSELAMMPPQERVAYLQEYEESDKHDTPKKGGLIERLIARGNKRTEEQLEREQREREEALKPTAPASLATGAGAGSQGAVATTTDGTIR